MKTLFSLALIATVAVASAQSTQEPAKRFGFSVAYDLCHKESLPVATYQIGTLHDVLKKPGLDFDIIGLTVSDSSGNVNLGMAAVKSFGLAREVSITVGPWVRYDGKATRLGVFIGIGGSL